MHPTATRNANTSRDSPYVVMVGGTSFSTLGAGAQETVQGYARDTAALHVELRHLLYPGQRVVFPELMSVTTSAEAEAAAVAATVAAVVVAAAAAEGDTSGGASISHGALAARHARRSATPSAAAEIITEGVFASRPFIEDANQRLRQLVTQQLEGKLEAWSQAAKRLDRTHPRRKINDWLQHLDEMTTSLDRRVRKGVRDGMVQFSINDIAQRTKIATTSISTSRSGAGHTRNGKSASGQSG